VRTLPARHRNEQSAVPANDLEPPDHERIIERHAHERLQLVIVPQRYTNLGDLDHEMFTSEPSLRFSWLVCGVDVRRRTWVERPLEDSPVAPPWTHGCEVAGPSPRNAPRRGARSPKSDP